MNLVKSVRRGLRKMLHPRSVGVVKHEGKTIDDAMANNTSMYLIIYFLIFFMFLTLISMASYNRFSDLSTVPLSFAMLLGRLEIFPLILAFSPAAWKKK